MTGIHVVTSARVAEALSLSKAAAYLQPFVDHGRTVKDAAAELGESIQVVHYWVQRLLALDLLTIVDSVHRPGRPMKVYRSVARSFVIPADLLPERMFPKAEAERLARMQAALELALPELVHDGDMTISFDPSGQVSLDRHFLPERGLLGEDTPAVLQTWMGLNLTRPQAKQLQAELWAILQRYRGLSAASAGQPAVATYEVHVALAPANTE